MGSELPNGSEWFRIPNLTMAYIRYFCVGWYCTAYIRYVCVGWYYTDDLSPCAWVQGLNEVAGGAKPGGVGG